MGRGAAPPLLFTTSTPTSATSMKASSAPTEVFRRRNDAAKRAGPAVVFDRDVTAPPLLRRSLTCRQPGIPDAVTIGQHGLTEPREEITHKPNTKHQETECETTRSLFPYYSMGSAFGLAAP